jgi:hypothetical protein
MLSYYIYLLLHPCDDASVLHADAMPQIYDKKVTNLLNYRAFI